MEGLISAKARRTTDPVISYLLKVALETPGIISLAAGLVDQETLPAKEVARLLGFLQQDERCRHLLPYPAAAEQRSPVFASNPVLRR